MRALPSTDPEIAAAVAEQLTGVPEYSGTQSRRLAAALRRAAVALEVGDETADRVLGASYWPYQLDVLVRALDAEAARLLGWTAQSPRTWVRLTGPPGAGGLAPAEPVLAIDANSAREKELTAVPGIGPVTARRIIAGRPYRRRQDIRTAAKLDRQAWELARPALVVLREPPLSRWPGGQPGVADLYIAVRSGAIGLPGSVTGAMTDAEAAATTVITLADAVAFGRTKPRLWAPSAERVATGMRGLATRQLPERPITTVAPVFGAAYPRLLLSLLAAATDVTITMFFVSANSALDDLISALGECVARGGRVRCLLADSLPGDVRAAHEVNQAARSALRDRRVGVRTWWPEVALHEKSVVVDRRHVLVGSHNWTASAFFRLREATLYLDSEATAADLTARFEARWRMLDPDRRRRVIALSELICLSTDATARLASQGIRTGAELPADRSQLRALGRAAHVPVADLALAAAVAPLMAQLRVCEVTAGCLVAAGLTTAEDVDATPEARLRTAIEDPQRLPTVLSRRPVNPAIVDVLLRRRRG
ncbi:phospholipase D-like domain-containing protein [Streptomyces sp. NPDC002156]